MISTAQPQPRCAALSIRAQISQLVTTVAVLGGEDKQAVFNRIHARLQLHYGIDLASLPRSNKEEDLLAVAERFGWLDLLYAFAYAEHLYQLAYEE